MNRGNDPMESMIREHLKPPEPGPGDEERFTSKVVKRIQGRRRRHRVFAVMAPVACAFLLWMVLSPLEEPAPWSTGSAVAEDSPAVAEDSPAVAEDSPAVAEDSPMDLDPSPPLETQGDDEDDLDVLWAKLWADVEGTRAPDTDEFEEETTSIDSDLAWMPSHYQALSQILGFDEQQEESL